MSWSADLDAFKECCKKHNIWIHSVMPEDFVESSFNIGSVINTIKMVHSRSFYSDLSRLIPNDPVKLKINVHGKIYKISLRCLHIACKAIARPGISTVNNWIKSFGMTPIGRAIKVKAEKYSGTYNNYRRGIFIGADIQLPNIDKLEFKIGVQYYGKHDLSIYKCFAEYAQILKLVHTFEKEHKNQIANIANIMTFVDAHPVIILVDGLPILYKSNVVANLDRYLPISYVCYFDGICSRPGCTYLHQAKCSFCSAYSCPAHIMHSHNDGQSSLMASMHYIYLIGSDSSDPETELIRMTRMEMTNGIKKVSIATHFLGADGTFKRETEYLPAEKKSSIKPIILDKELITSKVDCGYTRTPIMSFRQPSETSDRPPLSDLPPPMSDQNHFDSFDQSYIQPDYRQHMSGHSDDRHSSLNSKSHQDLHPMSGHSDDRHSAINSKSHQDLHPMSGHSDDRHRSLNSKSHQDLQHMSGHSDEQRQNSHQLPQDSEKQNLQTEQYRFDTSPIQSQLEQTTSSAFTKTSERTAWPTHNEVDVPWFIQNMPETPRSPLEPGEIRETPPFSPNSPNEKHTIDFLQSIFKGESPTKRRSSDDDGYTSKRSKK